MPEPDPEYASRVEFMTAEMAESSAVVGLHFVYVRIHEDIKPLERAAKYEVPLQEMLQNHGLGEVVGGGSSLGDGDAIDYCGVDIELTDRKQGIELLKSALQNLGAPQKTFIEEFLPEYFEHPVW
ncbi:hypothetical protein [Anatilimnocola floriformis]|uniref:hypothetical protein n=1 Tax=Anatilimnocola floriformis TaxID=2948575 RepID=UPI0020C497D9|nr:hypothetical protein [Anatilimnocola floriformis]